VYDAPVLAKPRWLLDRDQEWRALGRFVDRSQRLAVVYGPRRIGKSYLLDALCEGAGGFRYQAVSGVPATQVDDFGSSLGSWLGVGPLRLAGWADALDRLAQTELPLVVIDELPYLTETAPELTSLLQRYVDAKDGPPLVLAGSSLSTMAELVAPRAPLFGRSAAVVVPVPFAGRDLAELWHARDPVAALWVDAAVGGLPGYRPLLDPPGDDLDEWMVEEVLAPSSPLLDAAEAALVDVPDISTRGVYRAILGAIASGDRTFSAIARVAGLPSGALSRPLAALERAGLVSRVADPLRTRRDTYDLADPHLRTWLTVIAPHRSRLQAGRAAEVWERLRESTWRAQVLGPRWEAVARARVAEIAGVAGIAGGMLGPVDVVGATTVPDRAARTGHEVDVVAVRGREVVAVGEAKLRRLGTADLDRLRHVRELIGAPTARIVLASAEGVYADAAAAPDVLTITPSNVYA
jgi:uncharacterized protein